MDIEGKVAIVTGAGTGIGRATALALTSQIWLCHMDSKILDVFYSLKLALKATFRAT